MPLNIAVLYKSCRPILMSGIHSQLSSTVSIQVTVIKTCFFFSFGKVYCIWCVYISFYLLLFYFIILCTICTVYTSYAYALCKLRLLLCWWQCF